MAKTKATPHPHLSYLKSAGRTTGATLRSQAGAQFQGAGTEARPRLTCTLATESHQLLADLAEGSGLPRSYVLDVALALLAQHAEAVEPVLLELAQALIKGQLPVAELPAAAAALLPAPGSTSSTAPQHRGGPQPHPLRAQGVELLLEQRSSDGTWRRGAYAAIGRELGVNRQTVQSWASQLRASETPAATEIARRFLNIIETPRELALA